MSEPAIKRQDQPLDVARVRADFPAMSLTVHGRPLVFLDSGASAQKPRVVLDTMRRVYESEYANVHRGAYHLSERATARRSSSHATRRKRSTLSPMPGAGSSSRRATR
jgi:cysteine desulfurase/selenocysteine lyase